MFPGNKNLEALRYKKSTRKENKSDEISAKISWKRIENSSKANFFLLFYFLMKIWRKKSLRSALQSDYVSFWLCLMYARLCFAFILVYLVFMALFVIARVFAFLRCFAVETYSEFIIAIQLLMVLRDNSKSHSSYTQNLNVGKIGWCFINRARTFVLTSAYHFAVTFSDYTLCFESCAMNDVDVDERCLRCWKKAQKG